MDADRVLQPMNTGFIFPGGFAQYKPSFNQADQYSWDTGKDNGNLSWVLFLNCELIQAKPAKDKEQTNNTPQPSRDGSKVVFIQENPHIDMV